MVIQVKLKREKSRTSKKSGKPYHKWRLTPPEEAIKRLGWSDGDELVATVEGDALTIRKSDGLHQP